jgi:hypothetical protein
MLNICGHWDKSTPLDATLFLKMYAAGAAHGSLETLPWNGIQASPTQPLHATD